MEFLMSWAWVLLFSLMTLQFYSNTLKQKVLQKRGGTFCSLLVRFCSLFVSFCSLFVAFCLLLVTFCSLLISFCWFLVTFYSLLVTFCSLLITFCSLLVTLADLHWLFLLSMYCFERGLQIWIWYSHSK